MSITPFRRRPRCKPRHALFAEPGKSLPEALAEEDAKRAGVPAAVPGGAYPYEDIPAGEALAALGDEQPEAVNTEIPLTWDGMPAAGYIRHTPAPVTCPLDPAVRVETSAAPVIGDSLPAQEASEAPAPPLPPEYRVPLDSRAQFYTGKGWTETLTRTRIGSGEWDDVLAFADEALARDIAEEYMSHQHSRRTIGEGWRQVCIDAGRPDLIFPGWQMIRDLAKEAREEAARKEALERGTPVFTPAAPPAPPTRPQPVLREGAMRRRVA